MLRIPGRGSRQAAAIEEAIWGRMHFATHLRARRLGEFTVGTELHRSESLALVQLLILYHLVTVKATVAVGGEGTRGVHQARAPIARVTGEQPERLDGIMGAVRRPGRSSLTQLDARWLSLHRSGRLSAAVSGALLAGLVIASCWPQAASAAFDRALAPLGFELPSSAGS